MNKIQARKLSRAGTLSVGRLRQMIGTARPRGGFSRVNKQVPLEVACEIYLKALEGRPDKEIPAGMVHDAYVETRGYPESDYMKPSRDSMLISNILRDCS